MKYFLYRTLIMLPATSLLFTLSCTRLGQLVKSANPYHTGTYKSVCDKWSREVHIHRGLEVELIVSATFQSKEFRRAYANEYAEAYKLTPKAKKQFVKAQLKATTLSHQFIMAVFVPKKEWDDFNKLRSMWKLYLKNDKDERVRPVEVRKVSRQDAITPHFFPYITPWKSTYTIRFPYNIPGTNRPLIGDNTQEITFIITSVLGSGEMCWKLDQEQRIVK